MSLDRGALVGRHEPELVRPDPFSPLTVGNGEFAFTADITGLQTFPPAEPGATPLCTMAQWGWHSYGRGAAMGGREALRLKEYEAGGRRIGYMTDPSGQEELFAALRVDPHRLNLAGLAFVAGRGRPLEPGDLESPRQRLRLGAGRLESSFSWRGRPVGLETLVHPAADVLALRVRSGALAAGGLGILLAFPYGSHREDAADWGSAGRHGTEELGGFSPACRLLGRSLDRDRYFAAVRLGAGCRMERLGPHEFLISSGGPALELCLLFSPSRPRAEPPDFGACRAAAEEHWVRFWAEGGAIDLSGSADPRAPELERRIVLSQYLTAVQCAGSLPPAETGLTSNSWYGKFHLEMHYWHAAHFVLWGRPGLFVRSLDWYSRILGKARERAASQGYRGVRWPKMTDPSGEDSPSPIGPLLCWQQPHPIMYAELLERARGEGGRGRSASAGPSGGLPDREQLAELVYETADFMADYARLDEGGGQAGARRFVLGPPLIPAQERHAPEVALNPTFELEYWRWGLGRALAWARGRGRAWEAAAGRWGRVLSGLARPAAAPGPSGRAVYLAHERRPDTFGACATDHPSMLLALGMLPGGSVDPAVMSSTYDEVMKCWDFPSCWGWDFPAMAMTAARLGRPKDAVDALLMDTPKNTYRPNGHNAQLAGASGPEGEALYTTALPLYLPGNGSLLLAAGMMASGWEGCAERAAPGFPADGSWRLESEGIGRLP